MAPPGKSKFEQRKRPVSPQYPEQLTIIDADDVGDVRSERRVRVWPKSVSDIAAWCRKQKLEPISHKEVPGANHFERQQLAALGGVAAALAKRRPGRQSIRQFPEAVRQWLKASEEPPPQLVDAICEDIAAGADPLALIYERIVSGPRRRLLGTFFTPTPVLDYMHHVLRNLPEPAAVADPGAGVGAFTIAALKWWRESEVHAVDVNLVTLGLLAARPDLDRRPSDGLNRSRLRLRHEDFLEWLITRWPELDGARLLLGNPPYTRHQQLTASEKSAARAAVGSLAPGLRSGLSTYFLAASLAALKPKDALCLLLPANWLEADYAKSVRQRLWSVGTRPTELHLFPNDLNVFPGAQVAAMVLYVGPERSRRQKLKVVRVAGDLESGFRASVVNDIERVGVTPPSFSPRKLLASHVANRRASEATPLGVLANIRRGVATGANSFFLRTRSEADELPRHAYLPAISRLRDLIGDDLDEKEHLELSSKGVRCWMLNLQTGDASDPRIQRIIDEGVALSLHKRHLCKIRDPWYSLETVPTPDILVGPMGKEKFRVVVNSVGATPTNTLYGIQLKRRSDDVLPGAISELTNWLRSDIGQDALRSAARGHHGDGLVKLEPGALKQVQVPAHIAKFLEDG
ncbi:Eco57I restriction-modification methylase domain-containing protein [Asanoa sp. WMMD1127]|uniref:Eco57I restriction-modification methylase domain-containing protein n=1 Tax=Asanoa sp. WMMD1127 TaxID=3016107 RepID=UPI0024165850|nr:Eco57I restriction-modification methylase domain-containing protein [Asanoa sp. WMMD1127]MDG4823277.1 Eco57I restriction-modification methylase domain-containing protein [Asanoa sp. WMMD1127]